MEDHEKRKIACLGAVTRPANVLAVMQNTNDDDDLEEETLFLLRKEYTYRVQGSRPSVPRLHGYCERLVPQFSARTFQSHFRMEPHVVDSLENLISQYLMRQEDNGRPTIMPRKQILCTIWILATPDSYRSVAEKFGISKGSLYECVCRVVNAINQIVRQHIVWPEGQTICCLTICCNMEKENIKQSFLRLAGIPNIVGAIDGCHINIEAPNEHPSAYRTGKKKYAMQLQGVCTPDLIFIDCFAGYPASVHDSRVLRNSPLMRDAAHIFNTDEFIIGDKAYYPVRKWCIPPYKDNDHLTQAQKHFNKCHSKSRQVIERTFALLKGRFRRLKFLPMERTDRMPYFIMACCVLHNICRKNQVNDNDEEYIRDGASDSQIIYDGEEDSLGRDEVAGIAKRDYLKDFLWEQRTTNSTN